MSVDDFDDGGKPVEKNPYLAEYRARKRAEATGVLRPSSMRPSTVANSSRAGPTTAGRGRRMTVSLRENGEGANRVVTAVPVAMPIVSKVPPRLESEDIDGDENEVKEKGRDIGRDYMTQSMEDWLSRL
jgi:hypothetical protein